MNADALIPVRVADSCSECGRSDLMPGQLHRHRTSWVCAFARFRFVMDRAGWKRSKTDTKTLWTAGVEIRNVPCALYSSSADASLVTVPYSAAWPQLVLKNMRAEPYTGPYRVAERLRSRLEAIAERSLWPGIAPWPEDAFKRAYDHLELLRGLRVLA